MRFVLLGGSSTAQPLLRAIGEAPDHQLTHAAHVGAPMRDLLQAQPGVRIVPDCAEFPQVGEFDAVIVASEVPFVLDEAKQLARAGVSLVIFPSSGQTAAFAYELAIIADDSQAKLLPVFPQLARPEIVGLARQIDDSTWGRLTYMELNRQRIAKPPATHLSPAEIDASLFRDVVLLEHLVGEFGRVTALHSGTTRDGVSLASVTIAGVERPDVRWEFRVGETKDEWELTVAGERGQTTVAAVELSGDDGNAAESAEIGRRLLADVEQGLGGQTLRPGWNDVIRGFEVLEACRESLRRRRTIDLHFEATSERSIFKSQMTALGCGLLMLTLAAVLLLLAVGALAAVPAGVMRVLRIVVFLPLFAFLVLQILLVLARPPSSRS